MSFIQLAQIATKLSWNVSLHLLDVPMPSLIDSIAIFLASDEIPTDKSGSFVQVARVKIVLVGVGGMVFRINKGWKISEARQGRLIEILLSYWRVLDTIEIILFELDLISH